MTGFEQFPKLNALLESMKVEKGSSDMSYMRVYKPDLSREEYELEKLIERTKNV